MASKSVWLFTTLRVTIHHTGQCGRKLRVNYQFSSLHQVLMGNQPVTSLKRRAGLVDICMLGKRYANFPLTHHATRQAESKGVI